MKKEINPKVALAVVGVIVLILVGVYFAGNRGPAKVDASALPKSELEDKDPPRRGQPGYRQRTTDVPVGGTTGGDDAGK